jgi:hypothetical protein
VLHEFVPFVFEAVVDAEWTAVTIVAPRQRTVQNA